MLNPGSATLADVSGPPASPHVQYVSGPAATYDLALSILRKSGAAELDVRHATEAPIGERLSGAVDIRWKCAAHGQFVMSLPPLLLGLRFVCFRFVTQALKPAFHRVYSFIDHARHRSG